MFQLKSSSFSFIFKAPNFIFSLRTFMLFYKNYMWLLFFNDVNRPTEDSNRYSGRSRSMVYRGMNGSQNKAKLIETTVDFTLFWPSIELKGHHGPGSSWKSSDTYSWQVNISINLLRYYSTKTVPPFSSCFFQQFRQIKLMITLSPKTKFRTSS